MKAQYTAIRPSVPAIFFMLSLAASALLGALPATAVYAQSQKTSKDYIENARSLLKQASIEYRNGNYAKADELASNAYLDNFEYVEADLQRRNQSALMGELEEMMTAELRGMIKNKVSADDFDKEIAAIDAKLAQAYVIVPEFPVGAVIPIAMVFVTGAIVLTRLRERTTILPKS